MGVAESTVDYDPQSLLIRSKSTAKSATPPMMTLI
jgi:hypothetical protein